MTTTAKTIARRYAAQYADQPSAIHRVIDALCAHARRIAPAFGEETMEAGATNHRPTDGPRKALAWDCVQYAHWLNCFSDQPDLVALWFKRDLSAQDLANEATLRVEA